MKARLNTVPLLLLAVASTSASINPANAQPPTPTTDAAGGASAELEGGSTSYSAIAVSNADAVADVPAAPSASRSRMIDEVIVTAQKREENLQDVPISVQAFSADSLDARGISEPKELQQITPGLQYSVAAGYSLIYIRGVGTDAFIPSADASVATYVDNVYYPFGHGLASDFGAVKRVEVLKGPQGTLFGRNSTGGAINIVTEDPEPIAKTSFQTSYGSYDARSYRIYSNFPLTESLAFSISGLYSSQDNYYELTDSSPLGSLPSEVTKGFRAKLGWTPADAVSAVVGATHFKVDGALPLLLPAHEVKPLGMVTGIQEQADYKTDVNGPGFIALENTVLSADIKVGTELVDLRTLVSHQKIDSPTLTDYDGSRQPLVTVSAPKQFADVTTAELQITSNDTTPFSDKLTWIGGVYYLDSSAGFDPLQAGVASGLLSYLATTPASPAAALLTRLTALVNVPGGLTLQDILDNGVTLNVRGVLDTESTAGYFQGTYKLLDSLNLTVGGRYQTETRTLAKSTVGIVIDPSRPDTEVRAINFAEQKHDTSNFSPKVVLDYKATDDLMFYVSYSKGFKSGTYNIINIYKPAKYLDPEELTAYEVGFKGSLFDRSLQLNAAAFQNEISDLQVQTIALTSGGVAAFETAGGARIRGADFDMVWIPLPERLPGLVVTASGAYLDGTYTSYKEGSGYDELTGLYFDGTILPSRDFTGNVTARTPSFSGNSGVSYSFDLSDGTLEIAGDVYYNAGFYNNAQNTKTAEQDAYSVLNARISYLYNPWGLRVTAFAKNLTEAKYYVTNVDLDFATHKVLAAPRTYGIRVNLDF